MWQHAHSHSVCQSLAYEQSKYRSWPTKLWACDSISLTSAPHCRRVPREANMLHCKKICLLALSGQDAIKQTCHLSPVLPLVWLYLSTVESQLWIFPEFRILPHTWPKFCKNGSWVLLSLLLKYTCWNHLQSHLPLHICSKYKTPKNLLTKGCKLNQLKAIESCFAK